MDAYQLAKLVEWAGTLRTRKRLQKVVYLLQEAGCPLNVEYTLHHYGPYSVDVARQADTMVQAGLLNEEESLNPMMGRSFSYELSELARNQLDSVGRNPGISSRHTEFDEFELLARQLLDESDLPKLEYAATIAYFRNQVPERAWQAAREAAAIFKKQEPDSQVMRDAQDFARQILERENPD